MPGILTTGQLASLDPEMQKMESLCNELIEQHTPPLSPAQLISGLARRIIAYLPSTADRVMKQSGEGQHRERSARLIATLCPSCIIRPPITEIKHL